MISETMKPTHSHNDQGENQNKQQHKHKQLDREVRDMVNAITDRITDLHHKPGSSLHHHEDNDQDDHGVRIITLAGNNTGATMRSELEHDKNNPHGVHSFGEPEALSTYVNSNFQAVNNSIMLGSSYTTNDPGVHLDISDVYEHPHHQGHHEHHIGHKPDDSKIGGKNIKGKNKKDKESFKSDNKTEQSD